jgi:hypothetical protein
MYKVRNPLALAIVALLPAVAWSQDAPISGKEIQDTWAGKELVATGVNGARLFMRLEADGKASVSSASMSDTGTWRAHESGYCATWSRIRAGEERCFTVLKSGGNFKILNPDGSLSGVISSIR